MKKTAKQAFVATLPVLTGYVVLGVGFGIILKAGGYGVLLAFVMSLVIYAGSMQYVAIGLLSGGASLITVALTTLMVNARHLFYGISMLESYKDTGKRKPYLIFALTDETYSLVCNPDLNMSGEERNHYYFFVSLFNHFYWVLGLFASATGIVRDLEMKDVFVLVALSSTNGFQYSSSYGGFCARAGEQLILRNVTHTGEVKIVNNTGGAEYYGGLVGSFGGRYTEFDRSIFFEGCAVDGTLTNGGGFIGYVGDSLDGYITVTILFESCSNQTDISGISQFYDAYRFIARLDKSDSDVLIVEFENCQA